LSESGLVQRLLLQKKHMALRVEVIFKNKNHKDASNILLILIIIIAYTIVHKQQKYILYNIS